MRLDEVYQYTVGNATNSGTQTVYTGYQVQNTNTGTRSATNTYTFTQTYDEIIRVVQHLEILLIEKSKWWA